MHLGLLHALEHSTVGRDFATVPTAGAGAGTQREQPAAGFGAELTYCARAAIVEGTWLQRCLLE